MLTYISYLVITFIPLTEKEIYEYIIGFVPPFNNTFLTS